MKRHHMFRLLALTLVFTMVLGLVSCGNQPQQQSQTDTGTETSGQAEGVNLNYGISNSWDSPDALLQRFRQQLFPDHLRQAL